MKVVYRILFALLMVLLFWFSLNTANNIVTERYINENVMENLRGDEPDYLYFYGTVPSYNHRKPLYSYESETYNVRFFEILVSNDKGAKNEEYVYVLFHNKNTFELNKDYYIKINDQQDRYVFYPQGVIYDVLIMLDQEQIYIPKSYIESNLDKEWKLMYDEEVLLSFTPSLDRPFELKTKIETYVSNYGKLPKDELNSSNVYQFEQPDYSKYYIVYFTALSIYGIVFAFSIIVLMINDHRKGKRTLMDYENILKQRQIK